MAVFGFFDGKTIFGVVLDREGPCGPNWREIRPYVILFLIHRRAFGTLFVLK
jgi:hypothetical protein